jgi:two-component system, cell cycle sensor histidine kinase and response regulator CckA
MSQPLTKNITAAKNATTSKTILLAEDDRSVRSYIARSLQSAGYTVLEAVDGADAVRVSRDYREEIHLLLTDVIMPKINGKQAYLDIAASRPHIKVLYMSGYAEDIILHRGELELGTVLLQKPFSNTDLLGMTLTALESK